MPIVDELMIGFNSDEGSLFSMLTDVPTNASRATLEKAIDSWMHYVHPTNPKLFKSAAMFEYSKYSLNDSNQVWFESTSDYVGDLHYVRDVRNMAENFAGLRKRVYFYEFTHLPKHLRMPLL